MLIATHTAVKHQSQCTHQRLNGQAFQANGGCPIRDYFQPSGLYYNLKYGSSIIKCRQIEFPTTPLADDSLV